MPSPSRLPTGKRLFSFVVVADTHINETDAESRSPFQSNAKANERARHVFSEIATIEPRPEFIVHLGDIVHPVPSMPGFDEAARRYHAIAECAALPVHLVPGNHDVGDKNIDWMPADIVCDAYLDKYRSTFGRDYFDIDAGALKLLVVNALLFNSGLASEVTQKAWIDQQLRDTDKRVFIFIHYPPYLVSEDERSSYDNIDQPGRSWLVERLKHDKVEAVFAGHVHNFWYDVVGRAEMYMLPSTAFLRHDFTELYRVAPGAEFGRDDGEKFGYFVIDVHEHGHVARLVRTGGKTLADGAAHTRVRKLRTVHTKVSSLARFGAELRHPWAEIVAIPSTGGVQEFGRKPARNDYQLMAMWEMGLRTLKVPLQEFDDAHTLRRGRLMTEVGHDFIMTALGIPGAASVDRLADSQLALTAIEVNLALGKAAQRASELAALRARLKVPVLLSHLRTSEDAHFDGKHFSHFVNAGLRVDELEGRRAEIFALVASSAIDGITVRLDWGSDIVAAAQILEPFAQDLGIEILLSIKLGTHSLALENTDDQAIAMLAAKTAVVSFCSSRVRYVFDTFMDVDRGYFPRNGFIDRRFNPRLASRVVAGLCSMLERRTGAANLRGQRRGDSCFIEFDSAGVRYALVCGPAHDCASWVGKFPVPLSRAVDLATHHILAPSELALLTGASGTEFTAILLEG